MKVLRAAAAAAAMVACSAFTDAPDLGSVPQDEVLSLLHSRALCTPYDGQSDDLLTAGLGKTGLAGPAPAIAVPTNPTTAELRKLAIYNNYRALVDMTEAGGYGVLYGPNVQPDGTATADEGKIAGVECLTYADNGSGRKNVTLMVQIPASFDPQNACIITGPSSGSRGIYGAIATSGEWGLKHGCAVAYTDKGTGNGVHDLQNDTVNLIDGQRESADFAGKKSNFTAPTSDAERAAFNAATPNRFAFKHAHSRQNPEADWDVNVLQSIVFAFIELNKRYRPQVIRPGNTIVIASSVSNGGGASARAAEIDRWGLIDGVAVAEPNVNPPPGSPFAIVQDGQPPYRRGGKTLYDYFTQLNVFQGCANLAQPTAPFNITPAALGEARCTSLHAKGLLKSATLAGQAAEAQAILNRYGFLVEQNIVQPSHWAFFAPQAVAITYANAYARAGVEDNLCGFSFGATDATTGNPVAALTAAIAQIFATSNGIPPTGGVNVINNDSPGGPKQNTVSLSPSTNAADQNLDGALCLRGLWTGSDPVSGAPLTGKALAVHKQLRKGVVDILATADLGGTPAIFVMGRADAVVAPNHAARAYFARNRQIEQGASRLRYVEVTNAQHLDAFNALAGFDTRFIPLHVYFIQALDLMYAHLKTGAPLPNSQVVHTVPRGGVAGSAPPITTANVPPIEVAAPDEDRIRFANNTLRIPE